MRAKKYRMRKKQREIDCENNPQTLKNPKQIPKRRSNTTSEGKGADAANLTYYMTYLQQHPTQTYHQETTAQTYHPVHHRHPMNNGAWISARWNIEAIEGYPSTEALLSYKKTTIQTTKITTLLTTKEQTLTRYRIRNWQPL